MYWERASRALVEPAGIRMEQSTEKPERVHWSMLFANRSFRSLRCRKKAITLWRKHALILSTSTTGR